MFTNTFGIRLVLLLGDTVPLPAPYEVSSAFQRAEVTNDSGSGQGDGFQLTFALGRDASDYRLVQKNGPLATMKRVVIGVVFGVAPEVLIDGIITHHQFNPGTQPGQATLTVTGRDLTILLDLEEKNESYPNLADFVIVNKVLANYARYGVIPTAEKTTDFPVQIDRIPRQQETDLAFVRRLAERNGFVFYLEPITFGVSSAYWGPEQSKETPQPALSLNQGGATNLRSFDVNEDALGPVNSEGAVLNPDTKSGIAVSAVPSLTGPPLTSTPAETHRTRLGRDIAQHTVGTAATRMSAQTDRAPDALTATGELDCVRYGRALRARRLVGVRGVGWTHDGLWFVRSVTHAISRTGYSQRFQLGRDGTGALTPFLPP